jgi:hypothetical protein
MSQLIDIKQQLVARATSSTGSRRNQMYMEKQAFADQSTPGILAPKFTTRGGFAPLYHSDVVNHCPACGHTHWLIGRTTAECAFCDTALPLAASASQPMEPLFYYRGTKTAMLARA